VSLEPLSEDSNLPTDQNHQPVRKVQALYKNVWVLLAFPLVTIMAAENGLARLGLSTLWTLATVSPLLVWLALVFVNTTRTWSPLRRLFVAIVLYWLVRYPSTIALQNEAHTIETAIVLLVFFAIVVFFVVHAFGESADHVLTKEGSVVPRTISSHVNSDGSPKIGYSSSAAAARAAILLTKKDGATMGVYQCGTCPSWHVGHSK
jgi:hypothetical protein